MPGVSADRSRAAPIRALAWLAPVAIAAAALAAYANSFGGVFLFDDHKNVAANPALAPLLDLARLCFEQGDSGLAGRPLAALTFALDRARSGLDPAGYHAIAVGAHAAAALALWAVVRRALSQPPFAARWGDAAGPAAFATALAWAVHPLNTNAVAYISQRIEVLAGLFILLAFYAFLRACAAPRPGGWTAAAVACALCAACTKEIAVALLPLAWIYDARFVAGSARAALRARRALYLGLLGSWLVLAALVWSAGGRSDSVGFGFEELSAWDYLRVQGRALVLYLRLALWPSPLVFDYGTPVPGGVAEWLPHGLAVLALLASSAFALARRNGLGFLGAWFFLILAPSSSVLPIVTERIAEHRMYLPLAAVVLAAVIACAALLARLVAAERARRWIAAALSAAAALALSLATRARNLDYRSEIGMWADVVLKLPSNARAHASYANDLRVLGRLEEARRHYEEAVRLAPDVADWRANLGTFYMERGELERAIAELERAVALAPGHWIALQNLGSAYARRGELERAIECLEASLAAAPTNAAQIQAFVAELRARAKRAAR
jgi:tetratricopeptide (TPR) repeat protein